MTRIREQIRESIRKVTEALTPPESISTCEVQAEIDANPEIKAFVEKELARTNANLEATLRLQDELRLQGNL